MSWNSFLCKYFHIGCPAPEPPTPPVPPPPTPTPTARAIAVVIPGVPGAKVTLDSSTTPFVGTTNADGYVCFPDVPLSLTASHLWITADKYFPYDLHLDLPDHNVDYVVGGPVRPGQIGLPALQLAAPPRRSQAALCQIATSFCNLTDAKNRVIFTAFTGGLPTDERKMWYDALVADGCTHYVLSPEAAYPGSDVSVHLYDKPDQFVALIREVLNTRAKDGYAMTPILILDSGDPGIRDRINQYWTPIRQALGADEKDCIVVPGWELINASACTSAEYAYALQKLHADGWSHIWAHLAPGRAAFSSNPVEVDDPWQGEESGCWKSHGGEFIEGLLYQSQAVRPNDDTCNAADDSCWLNRWEDVVPRLGNGMNGWRIVHLCYFEGPAYFYWRRQCDSAFARRIATAAKKLADKYNVTVGFGNGLPY